MSTRRSHLENELFGACEAGDVERVRRVIADGVDPKKAVDLKWFNETPVHRACSYGSLEVLKYLIEVQGCSAECTDDLGQTPLHYACWHGHLEVVKYLIEVQGCSAECLGLTPLHYACRFGKLEVLKYLIEVQGCSAGCTEKKGLTPLHHACRWGKLEVIKYLIEAQGCSAGCTDNNGLTPLHHACRNLFGVDTTKIAAVITYLLEHTHCDPNCATHNGETPLDVAKEPEHLRLLLKFRATPSDSLINKHFPQQHQQEPASIKMFILGNPGAGKSTLVKSVKTEGGGMLDRIKHRLSKVADVDERTAGIIPYDIQSKALGRVTLYDFAGHREFYAGHDALLQNSMTTSPSIVALVIDMRGEEGQIRETLQYWFEFINNHSAKGRSELHLVIIGSHTDGLPSSEVKQKSRFLQQITKHHILDNISIVGHIMLDCRYAESSSMSQLRSVLSHSCQALRSSEAMAITHRCFMMFLLDKYRGQLAVKLSVAEGEMRRCADSVNYLYLNRVLSSSLIEVCEILNKRGDILFMKNNKQSENCWIVFDKAALLSKVSGVIFAPKGFKEHQNISTSTGVVPLSKLAPLFPKVDSDMITQFLCHLEFCQEIKDIGLVSLLAIEGQSSPTADERYLFFPGLVHLVTPQDVIMSSASNVAYNSGWVLQCSKSEQFFSNRFLQVLLLRLAFLFALAPTDPSTADHLALHRKCSVWKNGIYWVNRSGGEAIVDINNLRQVVVIVRSTLEKMELVRLRSAVINTVIRTKEEFCSKVLVKESLVLPEDAAVYPLDPSKVTGVSITEVAATIAEGNKFVINEKNRLVELEKLICFEPYASLGEPLLQKLLSEDITEDQEIADELLNDFAKHTHRNINEYCTILEQDIDECDSREGVRGLLQVFQLWRENSGKEGTQENFKKKLHQFSVFAGRNPLELITGRTPSAVATRSSSTNPAGHVYKHSSQYRESDSSSSSTAHCGETESQDYERNSSAPNIADQPKLHELQLLEGVDGRKVRTIETVAPYWKKLAVALGFDQSRIMIIEKDNRASTEEASQAMFMRWLDGEHDLAQPCTWDTLIKCLKRAQLVDFANSLRTILR